MMMLGSLGWRLSKNESLTFGIWRNYGEIHGGKPKGAIFGSLYGILIAPQRYIHIV
jgi:hypothetical protein